MGLGRCKTFTLAEARLRNRPISQQLADGIDPLAAKRARKAALLATAASRLRPSPPSSASAGRVRGCPPSPFLFIGARSEALSAAAMAAVMHRVGCSATIHGFRSSFSDWAHEQTAHSDHTIEISLAHSVGTEVARAYQRGNMIAKRVKLMTDWAKYCCSPPAVSDEVVVPIGRRAKSAQ